ncbi:MAG: NADPH-dependent glutamate synthase [Breznakia sp.]
MANMSLKKVDMPLQDATIRQQNYAEVELGYTLDMAKEEANRCLQCKHKPCIKGCPVAVEIPAFIQKVMEEDIIGAYHIIKETNALPAVCGRVCPQETQCEAVCVRAIKGEAVGIGRLERFVADYYLHNIKTPTMTTAMNGYKVAIVGSGPAGLSCAGDLVKKGYEVHIFEALHIAGGVLAYGIPEFRLPKTIVKKEIAALIALGVIIETDMVIGKTLEIDELFAHGFHAVFVGSGAGLPKFMNIPGENANGVFSANEFLTRVNLMKAYETDSDTPIFKANKVAVVGGGNVAMDAARSAKRLGASEVYVVYRRGMEELPARMEEIKHAQEEGIIFKTLVNPIAIISDDKGNTKAMECVEMTLGEKDESGRRRPIVKANSSFILDVDCVIISVGTSPNPLISNTTKGLDTNAYGCLLADENGKTSKAGVFAGGDAVSGAATVILAMGAGRNAAKAMDVYIKKNHSKTKER